MKNDICGVKKTCSDKKQMNHLPDASVKYFQLYNMDGLQHDSPTYVNKVINAI